MKRTCGGCCLCCKLFEVQELIKPRDTWCRHCVIGVGCGIHPDWPKTCNDFFCLWRDERLAVALPDDVRPDRCGVVLAAAGGGKAIVAVCQPDKPFAWRDDERIFRFLLSAANAGISVSIRAGKSYFILGRRGFIEVPKQFVKGNMDGTGEFEVEIPEHIRRSVGIGPEAPLGALPPQQNVNPVQH
jgi:uncharacterized protein